MKIIITFEKEVARKSVTHIEDSMKFKPGQILDLGSHLNKSYTIQNNVASLVNSPDEKNFNMEIGIDDAWFWRTFIRAFDMMKNFYDGFGSFIHGIVGGLKSQVKFFMQNLKSYEEIIDLECGDQIILNENGEKCRIADGQLMTYKEFDEYMDKKYKNNTAESDGESDQQDNA